MKLNTIEKVKKPLFSTISFFCAIIILIKLSIYVIHFIDSYAFLLPSFFLLLILIFFYKLLPNYISFSLALSIFFSITFLTIYVLWMGILLESSGEGPFFAKELNLRSSNYKILGETKYRKGYLQIIQLKDKLDLIFTYHENNKLIWSNKLNENNNFTFSNIDSIDLRMGVFRDRLYFQTISNLGTGCVTLYIWKFGGLEYYFFTRYD